MSERNLSQLFTWRGALSEPDSGLTSVERHVALALSLHMNERGGSCFPSVATLAGETSLDERTVQRALRALRDAGWIGVKVGGGRGNPNRYTAAVPQWVADKQGFSATESAERVAPTSRKGGTHEGGGRQEDVYPPTPLEVCAVEGCVNGWLSEFGSTEVEPCPECRPEAMVS